MHSIKHEWASVVVASLRWSGEWVRENERKTIFILILLLNCYLLFASVAMLIPHSKWVFSSSSMWKHRREIKNNNNSICLRICHENSDERWWGVFILYHFLLRWKMRRFSRWKYWITIWAWELSAMNYVLRFRVRIPNINHKHALGFSKCYVERVFFFPLWHITKAKIFSLMFFWHVSIEIGKFTKQIKLYFCVISSSSPEATSICILMAFALLTTKNLI